MTGFKLAGRVNARLNELELKPIPPQMIYRYFDQKLIPFEIIEGQKQVSEDDAEVWIEKYVAKRIAKSA
jgi:hypothetical protein